MSTINEYNLTGEELEINNKSYLIKLKNGVEFNVGKLLERTAVFCPFHGIQSNYNSFYVFEHNPENTCLFPTFSEISLCKLFKEVKNN
jgi:hypothetical protein